MPQQIELIAGSGVRLDRFLAAELPELSRSHLQNLIKQGQVLVNGIPATKSGQNLVGGELVELTLPDAEEVPLIAENIPLDIYYEDTDIIVVNKPQGLVVHPAAGHQSGTLVNALLGHCGDLSGINGQIRPGIVHRLDKDTSGLLVAAKNDAAHIGLAEQWSDHSVKRIYHALLHGVMKENSGIVDAPIGRHPRDRKKMAIETTHGRDAVTNYRVLQRLPDFTYCECELKTGRTHQIRVHLAHIGHPVLGDPTYGPKKPPLKLDGQVLHAKTLGFKHPCTGEYLEFDSPLPDYFQQLLEELGG